MLNGQLTDHSILNIFASVSYLSLSCITRKLYHIYTETIYYCILY